MNKLFTTSIFLGLLAISPAYAAGDGGGDYIYVDNKTLDNTVTSLGSASAEVLWGLIEAGVDVSGIAGSVDIDVVKGTDVFVTNHTGTNIVRGGGSAGSVKIKQRK